MASHGTTSAANSNPSPFSIDFKRKPLSIRSLGRRRRIDPRPPLERVRSEFVEMRGFCPTLEQAARMFDLPVDECARILTTLVNDGSLRQDETGRYRLAS
jgi:hypothetical protein